MKLSTDSKTLAENKLLILYILNKVNKPMENEALLKLVLSVTDMNYFYFQQFLLDLINSKFIYHYNDSENIYEITDSGKEVLDLTKNIIPGILKFKVDKNFKENIDEIRQEFAITAEFALENESEYNVTLKIVENTKPIFELTTFAGSVQQAKAIVENWKSNSDQIYPKILELLSENPEQNIATK